MAAIKDSSPGPNPSWVDKEKGYEKKNAQFPLEIADAIIRARDLRIPASAVESAINRVIEQTIAYKG